MNAQRSDEDAWNDCDPRDRWLFDKLLLAAHLGYRCGPCGVAVPEAGHYVVRPIMNLAGMGAGAEIRYLRPPEVVEPGYFWCERFEGRHLSVDYDRGRKPVRVVEGFRAPAAPLYRWLRWAECRLDEAPPFPEIPVTGDYPILNVEFIGGRVIEAHLRANPDPPNVRVHWQTDPVTPPADSFFWAIDDADGFLPEARLGFVE